MINFKIRARNLINKYNTRNPYILCKKLNITIVENNFSEDMPKAIFKKILRRKFIILNMSKIINEQDKLFSLYHEMGHALFHASNSISYLHDHTFCVRSRFEIEANKFAAELMINENMLDEEQIHEMNIEQLAVYYAVPLELAQYKFSQNK